MKIDKQKGVSLIITFFIMLIVLAIVLSISALLYSEVKVIRNISNSMASLYAADSGIEKVLYYDRQIIPSGATRGLCSMLTFISKDTPYCITNISSNPSIYCNNPVITPLATGGCAVNNCTNCQISFHSVFNDGGAYYVTAKVYFDGMFSNLEIESKGVFGSAGRQIKIRFEGNPPCGGHFTNGHCWYTGEVGQSCTDVCADKGRTASTDCCETDAYGAVSSYFFGGCSLVGSCPVLYYSLGYFGNICYTCPVYDYSNCNCDEVFPWWNRVCACKY